MQQESSYGPVIGLIIIILIIVLGSVYFLQERTEDVLEDTAPIEHVVDTTPEEEAAVLETIENQSTDTSLDSIEEDLLGTNLENLEDIHIDDLEL